MADTLTHANFSNLGPFPDLGCAWIVRKFDDTTLGTTINDILKLAKARRGLRIIDAYIQASDGDTHTTPTLALSLLVTDGTTTKTIIDQSTIGQGGGIIRPTKAPATENGVGYVIPSDDYEFQLKATAAGATFAAWDGVVAICVSPHRFVGEITE